MMKHPIKISSHPAFYGNLYSRLATKSHDCLCHSPKAVVFLLLFLVFFSSPAQSAVLTSDTTWSGEISLEQDVLVPEGVTLTILPGAMIKVTASESTKTDPEFLSPLTEITVRGRLIAEGTRKAPITFHLDGASEGVWAGIIIDGGAATFRSVVVVDADTGISVTGGSLSLLNSRLTGNRYGLTVHGAGSRARVRSSDIKENEYGVLLLNGARIDAGGNTIAANTKKDTHSASAKGYRGQDMDYSPKAGKSPKSRVYADDILLGSTIWQGRIEVNGTIRVPENSRLFIMPGTVVEFTKKDTNGDGIGENGMLIQGMLIAKGTPEKPILFRSGEKQRKRGDWDSLNIMNSDKARNLIEYCQIEDAYRGLHFHFSNVAVTDAVIRNNYRGIQFQESVVEIRGTNFYSNKSGVQARDSEILFTDNVVAGNMSGMNVLRNSITARGNVFRNNSQEGLKVREGLPVIEGNLLDGNRHGLMVTDAVYGSYQGNVVTRNMESGIYLKGTDSIEISGNFIQANGINGINIQDSAASIQGNLISDNGERGIGVQSFQGVITGNNILRNGLYNLGLDGPSDVAARMNWWGNGDVRKTIYDKENDATRGSADYQPLLDKPVTVSWPLKTVSSDIVWHGDLGIAGRVTVEPGVRLVLSPGSRILFSNSAGLTVKGILLARGEKKAATVFTSAQNGGPGEWDEILLDHAAGSEFINCIFENAAWALHSHFTNLKVESSLFRQNLGGLRFTSGPVEVRSSVFSQNDVAIRSFRGTARITGNEISGNRIGIFVREKGGGLTVDGNNIHANTDYNIRLGDFNTEDVNARGNWWGEGMPSAAIYDEQSEPGIGTVQYSPYADRPLGIRLPDFMTVPAGMRDGREVDVKSPGEKERNRRNGEKDSP